MNTVNTTEKIPALSWEDTTEKPATIQRSWVMPTEEESATPDDSTATIIMTLLAAAGISALLFAVSLML